MKRLLLSIATGLLLLQSMNSAVADTCPNGQVMITPHGSYFPLPVMLSSPATFSIVATESLEGFFPNIVLVMTKASYEGLTGPIVVSWTGKSGEVNQSVFAEQSFQAADSGYIPPQQVTSFDSGRYKVSDLKERLGVNATEDDVLYYSFGPFLGGRTVNQNSQTFTVTLPSTKPRMLVLAVAQTTCARFFNMRAPPCAPGFVVPEMSTALVAAASFIVLGFCSLKRRKM